MKVAIAVAMIFCVAPSGAAADQPIERPGPWYVEAHVGGLNDSHWSEAVFLTHQTAMTGDVLAGVGVGREIFRPAAGFGVELGLLFNKRFGEGGLEAAAPIALTFDGFPWRNRLPMRLRIAIGPSLATKISPSERRQADGGGSNFLFMLNPEIELGWPTAPEWGAFFRLHHRSGTFGLIKGIQDGSTHFMAGVRRRFVVVGAKPSR